MVQRGHCIVILPGAAGEVRFVNKLSGLPASATHSTGFDVSRPSYCTGAMPAALLHSEIAGAQVQRGLILRDTQPSARIPPSGNALLLLRETDP
jgi:hypothetical protein